MKYGSGKSLLTEILIKDKTKSIIRFQPSHK